MNDMMQQSIEKMIREITGILQGRVHSAWLYGSVVMDDFRLGWSDIDFFVLADAPLTAQEADKLLFLRQSLSEQERDNPYYRCFEGVIVGREAYQKKEKTRLVYWGTTGQRVADHYELDAFSALSLARYGRHIGGREQESVFSEPSREALTGAVRAHYDCIRKYAVQTDERLYACGWLLDIARCVYTLRTFDLIPKSRAGEWALENHIFPHEEALQKTLMIRKDPLRWKQDEGVKAWLSALGPTVQKYADVLEKELSGLGNDN